MLTEPLLAIILAACGVNSSLATTESPANRKPPAEPPHEGESYWCCDSVNGQGNGSGGGCEQILQEHVILCDKVLHCTKGYTNDDGSVTCTEG
jgi:hypothetical protein